MADRRRRLRFTCRPWRYYLGITLGWVGAESAAFTLPHLHHRLAGAIAVPACVLLGAVLGYAWESAAIREEGHDGDTYSGIDEWFSRRLEFMPCDDDLELHDALLMAAHAIDAAIDVHPTKAILDAIAGALGINSEPARVIDGEAVGALGRCEACREQRAPHVHFTAGGFVCEDCATYLPIGCQHCHHHYDYVKRGVCAVNVGRMKAEGMWYGPCGCRDFIAPEKLPPLTPVLMERIEGARKGVEGD